MSNDIAKMNDKQLRNEVQLLRDELAIMKRKYEDILYNLDDDNFSSKLLREKDNMKTEIEINAEGIKSKVSKGDLDEVLSEYSTISQTASQISATVTKAYVTNLIGNEYVTDNVLKSQLDIQADGIYSTVSNTYQTKSDANSAYGSLSGSISSVSQTASSISTRVSKVENGKFGKYTLFEQTADGFELTGDVTVNGSAVVGGTITGASLQNSTGTTKITLGHYTGSTVGDMLLNRIDSGGNEQTIFSVIDNFQSIYLSAMGTAMLLSSGTTTYPKGTWNFKDCTVEGITGGSTGGTAVAVFG